MSQQARDYQKKSIELIKSEFMMGHKKVLLWLATGAGKTFTFCDMVKTASNKGKRSIIVVRGRKLVDQASKRLFREHVPHGVLMNGHWNYRPQMPVQVVSIDTAISRNLKPEADLIIIDEVHLFGIDSKASQFIAQYDNAFVIGVTATPWVPKGLIHLADTVVHPISMQELIDQGYLCDFRYFAPSEPDLTGVKISSSTKDYVNNQLEDAMVAGQLTGKIIDHWKKIAPDMPTLLFAVNIHHSKILTEKFRAAGIAAEHCDADTPDAEREEIIFRLESGQTKIICNVGIFCTGVDIPCLRAIIMARPTMSLNLFIQQAGRGTRVFPGKEKCILLDHAGNIVRHGFPTEESEVDLSGSQSSTHIRKSKICKNCFCVYRGTICPECGVEPPEREMALIEESEAELKEIKKRERNPIEQFIIDLEKQRKKSKYKKGWTWHKLVDRFGFEECKPYLPLWFIDKIESGRSNIFSHSPFRGLQRND